MFIKLNNLFYMNIWCLRWWHMLWLIFYFNRNHLRVLDGRTVAHRSQQPAAPSLHFPSLSVKQREKYFRFFQNYLCLRAQMSWTFYEDFACLCDSWPYKLAYIYIHIFFLVRFLLRLNKGQGNHSIQSQ